MRPTPAALGRKALSAVDPNDWAELTFRFHPSLRRLPLAWNSVAVWQALSADEEPPDPESARQPVKWLLWRQNLKNYFRSMDEIECRLRRRTRGQAFRRDLRAPDRVAGARGNPLNAATLIGTWADSGLIVGIE